MRKQWLTVLMAVLVFLAGSVCLAKTTVPPVPTESIYVQDYGKILTPETKQSINELGAKLNAASKAQVVVVTLPSLAGSSIDELSLEIFRKWGIGDKKLKNGVLLLVAVNDKKSRIEVGYGLEGALPDAKTGEVQDKYLLPAFKKGDYNTGIINTYQVLVAITAKEYNVVLETGAEQPAAQAVQQKNAAAAEAAKPDVPFTLLDCYFLLNWVVLLLLIAFKVLGWMWAGFFSGGGPGGGNGNGFDNNSDSYSSSDNNDSYGGGDGGGGGSDRDW